MKNFFKLIRYKNLIFIVFFYAMFRFGFLNQQGIELALTNVEYIMFILAMLCLVAAGYVINDIMDIEADRINKPRKVIVKEKISEKSAYYIYVALNVVGVGIGFYLTQMIQKPNLLILYIILASLLYFYAINLKKIVAVKNLVIALIMFLSVMLIAVMDLYPKIEIYGLEVLRVYFDLLLDYAWFAFFITLIREIVKDMEDEIGDRELNYNTLPIVFGFKKTTYIVAALSLFIIGFLVNYINTYHMTSDLYWASSYLFLTVIGPLIWCVIQIFKSKKPADYGVISKVLKIIMFFGIISLLVTQYNILNK